MRAEDEDTARRICCNYSSVWICARAVNRNSIKTLGPPSTFGI
jgi:hypothetical protein